jgi:hypothetical protein
VAVSIRPLVKVAGDKPVALSPTKRLTASASGGPEGADTLACAYGCPDRAVPGEVNRCKHLVPCDDSWWSGHPAIGFQIATEDTAFIDNVRPLQVSHFDSAISNWGMPPRCRTGAGERVHSQGEGMSLAEWCLRPGVWGHPDTKESGTS